MSADTVGLIKLAAAYTGFMVIMLSMLWVMMHFHYANEKPKLVRVVFTDDMYVIQHKVWRWWLYTRYKGQNLKYATQEQAFDRVKTLLAPKTFKVIATIGVGENDGT